MTDKQPSNFQKTLDRHNLTLTRDATTMLQVNVGLACDLLCRHCHLEAGPGRTEMMNSAVMTEIVACARRLPFTDIDLTGGAPELLPGLADLVVSLAALTPRLSVRTNLLALSRPESAELPGIYRDHRVTIVASLPTTNPGQTEAQRGSGVWARSLAMLKFLNSLGYGMEGSGLELNLVSNPSGAFLPPPQAQAEKKFRHDLERQHGIRFNRLFTFANVPLGRFRNWLERSGNLETYQHKLERSFNPCTLPGLMCRSLISVNWDGYLYDCDFNLAAGLFHGEQRRHISQFTAFPREGTPIPVGDHCFACTAGSGFT